MVAAKYTVLVTKHTNSNNHLNGSYKIQKVQTKSKIVLTKQK